MNGDGYQGVRLRGQGHGSEAKEVRFRELLFADDTTIVGTKEEMDGGVNAMKEVMGRFEERSNDHKEECLDFCMEESDSIRMLVSWVSTKEDVNMRLGRAGGLWAKVKEQLKNTRLSKRIVQACVESALLFDCQARVWWKKDVMRLQKLMDKCWRYSWSNRNGEPLRQMQARGENMYDVRAKLGVNSVQWKIEKRVLERVGHVMRMKDESLTKVAVFGMYKKLEGVNKAPGKKRKTVLYWKRILSEAGIDWTDVGRLASDRSGWKKLVKERMYHLDVFERQLGHGYVWGDGEKRLVRNERRVNEDLRCRYEGCQRLCRSRADSVRHESMMHRRVEGRVRFACEDCGLEVVTKGALVGHRRACGAGRRLEDGRRECGGCVARVSYANFARHVRSCRAGGRGAMAAGDGEGGGVGRGADSEGRGVGGGG